MAKILVIDDEEAIRKHFVFLLGRLGHEVVVAADGDEGCRMAVDPSIQVIITDYCMPGQFQETALIRELRRLRPETPMVVISGYPDNDIMQDCEDLGVRDFLTKPFELSFVSSVIDKLLDGASGAAR